MRHAVRRRAIAAIAISLILIIPSVRAQDEVRALWVVRATRPSPSAVATMVVGAAKNGGFNTIIVENAQTARRPGIAGIILFSYDSLADPVHGPGYVSQVGRATFTTSQQ